MLFNSLKRFSLRSISFENKTNTISNRSGRNIYQLTLLIMFFQITNWKKSCKKDSINEQIIKTISQKSAIRQWQRRRPALQKCQKRICVIMLHILSKTSQALFTTFHDALNQQFVITAEMVFLGTHQLTETSMQVREKTKITINKIKTIAHLIYYYESSQFQVSIT